MSNVEAFTDGIEPFNGTTVALYNTAISGTAPSTDDILTADSATAGSWQTGAGALKTSGAPVVVSGSSAASGQALQASSATVASWVDFSVNNKTSVRAATTEAGTLASSFENGDTVDGVVLVTSDRILIKDQSAGTENGIYIVQASGAPVRSDDFASGASVGGSFVFVQEGTVNREVGYLCTNVSGVVGTDSLVFQVFSSAGRRVLVNTVEGVTSALSAGASYIQIAAGNYLIDPLNVTQNNVVIEGLGEVTIERSIGANTIFLNGVDNVTLKNITIDGGNGTGIRIQNGCTNIRLDNCRFIDCATGLFGSTDPTGLYVNNCIFDMSSGSSIAASITNGATDIVFSGCDFSSSVTINRHLNILCTNVVIKECFFRGTAQTGIRVVAGTAGADKVIICDCMFRDQTVASIAIETSGGNVAPIIVSNCTFDNTEGIVSDEPVMVQGCHFADVTDDCVFLDTADSSFSSICNNAFLNPGTFAVQVGTNSNNNLIADNAFEPLTSSSNFVNFVSLASSTLTKITRNNGAYILNTSNGSTNFDGDFDVTVVSTTSGGGDNIMSLQDLSRGSAGHYTAFKVDSVAGGDFVVTPVNTTQTGGTSYTSLRFNAAAETAALQWTGRGWKIFSVGTSTLVP